VLSSTSRCAVGLVCCIAIGACARSANAQVETTPEFTPAPPPAPAPTAAAEPVSVAPVSAFASEDAKTESYWYGWQTLTADGLSIATMMAGGAIKAPGLSYVGAGGLFLGAPIVHFANARVGAGFGSLGLRVGMPTLGAMIGYAAAGPCHDQSGFGCIFHGWGEAIVGGLIGMGGAIALDASVLAHGEREVEHPRETGLPRVTSVAPSFDPLSRTASVGMGGTF
jgi:hypothetical protein